MIVGSTRQAKWRLWALLVLLAATVTVLTNAAGSRADDLEYVSNTITVPSTLPRANGRGNDAIDCPGSHPRVTGGGVGLTGDNSSFDLEVSTTNAGADETWVGEANNTSGSPAQMTTTAICARGAANRFDHAAAVKNIAPGGQATRKVFCPSGFEVTGGGVTTESDSPKVQIAATKPIDGPDGNSTPDDGWLGSANNGTGSAKEMRTFAKCSNSGKYKYVHSAPKPLPNNSVEAAHASCPAGTQVSGGGVENSGIDVGAEIESSFPFPDQDWIGRANNDNTGQAETVQVFAICKVEEVRSFSGTVGGGLVSFKAKFEANDPVKVLPRFTFVNVPIHCENADTTHTVDVLRRILVRHNNFHFQTDSEIGQPDAAFKATGHFNQDGTKATGTYREHGNLKSSNGTFIFTNCDTGTINWSAQVP